MILLLLPALIACGLEADEPSEPTTSVEVPTPDVVPHVNAPPAGDGLPGGPPKVPHGQGTPDGEGAAVAAAPAEGAPDGPPQPPRVLSPPMPPDAEPIRPDGHEIPPAPPELRGGGPSILIRGEVIGMDEGQVRFTEKTSDGWAIVEVNRVQGGHFAIPAPANVPNPVYVSVASDLTDDGPSDDDLSGALAEPIRIGNQDLDLRIQVGTVPAWAQTQEPPIHHVLPREAVLAERDR
ncbi:MAG: hypothetical protein H6739_15550 [Alphaproteobacteria bacterium]|nr:hypothetical protein [Alphaproteobacteria bacterium]